LAAPKVVVESALEELFRRITSSERSWNSTTRRVKSAQSPACPLDNGKVLVLSELEKAQQRAPNHTIYMGDGSSDLSVMQHVNGCEDTASRCRRPNTGTYRQTHRAERQCAQCPGADPRRHLEMELTQIRELFASYGLTVHEWDRVRTDWLTFHESSPAVERAV